METLSLEPPRLTRAFVVARSCATIVLCITFLAIRQPHPEQGRSQSARSVQAPPVLLDSPTFSRPRPMVPMCTHHRYPASPAAIEVLRGVLARGVRSPASRGGRISLHDMSAGSQAVFISAGAS